MDRQLSWKLCILTSGVPRSQRYKRRASRHEARPARQAHPARELSKTPVMTKRNMPPTWVGGLAGPH